MSNSEDIVLSLVEVRYKKQDGSLLLTKSRIGWSPEGTSDLVSNTLYSEIKSTVCLGLVAWCLVALLVNPQITDSVRKEAPKFSFSLCCRTGILLIFILLVVMLSRRGRTSRSCSRSLFPSPYLRLLLDSSQNATSLVTCM